MKVRVIKYNKFLLKHPYRDLNLKIVTKELSFLHYSNNKATSRLSKIHGPPDNPIELFKSLIQRFQGTPAANTDTLCKTKGSILISLSTLDNEFGLLNRNVVYRGLIDNSSICFVTERNSRKYRNLLCNPKVAATILLGLRNSNDENEIWQIRLIDAQAKEINDADVLSELWEEEQLHAKIRSYICECGKPVDFEQLQNKHNELLAKYEADEIDLKRTNTYTAFKITTKLWDFYKSEQFSISDRLQYKQNDENPTKWNIYHVAA